MKIEQRVKYTTLEELDQLKIWQDVLGYTPKLGNSQTNTLRPDNSPGSVSFFSKNGVYYLHDFADPNFSKMDCVQAYALRNNIDIKKAWKEVLSKKQYSLPYIFQHVNTKPASVKVTTQPFNKDDVDYFKSQGVDINDNNILFKVKDCYINGKKLIFYKSTFCYYFKESKHVKIYSPFEDKRYKWLGNTTSDDVYGLSDLAYISDTLIVTKSGKDYLALKAIAKTHNLDYEVIAPNSESSLMPCIAELKNKYRRIIFIYDNDEAGIRYAKRNALFYQCEYLILPFLQKDPTDIIKSSLINELISWLSNLKEKQQDQL